MSIIKCPECNKRISDKAESCPKCGYPIRGCVSIANTQQITVEQTNANIKKEKGNTKKVKTISVVSAIMVVIMAVCHLLFNQSTSVEEVKDSMVKISAVDKNEYVYAEGSGFCIFEENLIVTNFHVVEGAYSILIETDEGEEYEVEDVVFYCPNKDIAILKVDDVSLKPLKVCEKENYKNGDKVTAIGSPIGLRNTISEGIISNDVYTDYIQTSAPISHGSSGGVLLNEKNEVIGITSMGSDYAENIGFAIPIKVVKELYQDYQKNIYYLYSSLESGYTSLDDYYKNEYSFTRSEINGYEIIVPSNMRLFYENTNDYELFVKIVSSNENYSGGVSDIFTSMTVSEKERVYNRFLTLITAYFEDERSINNINQWYCEDLFFLYDFLSVPEIAIIETKLGDCSTPNEQFIEVEKWYYSAAEKSLILYLLGDFTWQDIHPDNKNDIFEYINNCEKLYDFKDMGRILEWLGYYVEYNNDGTLTAYW